MDWDIVPKDGYEYEWVAEGIKKIKDFFNHPNHNNEGFQSLLRAWIKDMLEIDAAVFVKVFDIGSYDFNEVEPKSGAPMLKPIGQRTMTELYVRDGASFLKEIDKFGFCTGYWQYSYQIPAHPMWFHRDEIAYGVEHPRSMSCYGYARTQAILDIIKSLHYSTLYNKRFFEDTAIPDGALALLDTNEEEMKDFRDYWNNEFKGQPHKLAIINKDVKFNPFIVSNRELEFLDTQKWYFNLAISMFGLTPAELGITDDVNRATGATQAELVKRKGIRPFLKVIENAINKGIIPEFQVEGVEWQFIYDDPAEKAARLANWQTELNMNVKTPNEVRVEMGLEPVAGGDMLNIQRMEISSGENAGNPGKNDATDSKRETDGGPEAPKAKESMAREEGDSKKKADIEFDEVRRKTENPYGEDKRMKMLKSGYKTMSYDDLIAEHTKLVGILQSGDSEQIKREAEKQKQELEQYIRDSRMEKAGYVMPIGQYYNEQPISQPLRPSGAHFQPQNQRNPPVDTHPSHLGDSFQVPGRDTFNSEEKGDLIHCPMCALPTLTVLNAMENIPEDIRCTNCGARFKSEEILNAKLMEEMTNVLTMSNMVNPVSIPRGRYKSFDFQKSMPLALDYIDSPQYKSMLRKYLSDLSQEDINRIILILKHGLKSGKSIKDISKSIMLIVKDQERADKIARTEITRVSTEGNRLVMKERGATKVKWFSAPNDGRLCKICASLNGRIFDIDKVPNPADVHNNCRCTYSEYYGE